MASPTCDYLQPFANLGIGAGEVAALRVDATYINAFGLDLARSQGVRMSSGDVAVDAGSIVGQCVVSLRSDSSRTGIIKAGDYFTVVELSTGTVWAGTCSVDDIVSFSTLGVGVDGMLYEGVAPGNYALPAFIDDLRIEIRHQLIRKIQVQDINLADGDVGALQTNNILRPGGAVLENDFAAEEARFLVDHGAAGDHNAGVIEEDDFADTAFENFNYANLLANGGAEVGFGAAGSPDPDTADNPPFYWSMVFGREPNALYITNAQAYEGRCSCRADFAAANQAVDLEFDPLEFDVAQHVGKWVALTVAVRATVADSITVGFNGAVGGEVQSAQGGNAGAWTIMTYITQIDAAETGLIVRLVNQEPGVNVTYFDAAITVLGSKPVAFKRSTWEDGALEARHVSVYNLALNHLFSYWTNGNLADPDTWESLGTCVTIQGAGAGNYTRGDFSADVTLPDNAGTFRQTLGYSPGNKLAEALRSRYVTAKFSVLWIAGAKNLWVTLRSNVGGNFERVIIDLPSCQPNFVPCAVIALEVDAAATDIYLEFENGDAGAGQIDFYLDDVQITATPWPCPPVIPNYFEIETETWGYQGTCDASLGAVDLFRADVGQWGTNLGHQLGYYGVPLRAYAEANGGPAVGVTTFTLLVNGAAVGTVPITNPATAGMAHANAPGLWSRILPTDFIRIEASVGSPAVDDPVIRWVILKSAANTSEV